MGALLGRVKRGFQGRRDAWPWFDHLVRAAGRYKADGGDRMAAALTMYAIFALLPLLLVAMSVLGYAIAGDPDRQREVFIKVSSALPGVGEQLGNALVVVKDHRAATGIVGLAGLVFSGLGGIDALRDALRLMWHHDVEAGNFFKKKGTDLLTVLLIGVTLAVSIGVSALATGGAGALLDRAGIGGTFAHGVLYVLSFGVGVLVDAALFLVLFKWLPRVDWPLRRLVRGAVFGGFLFGVLKVLGGWYVGRTATRSTALYGSIGTAVALLVGLYLISRVILFTAVWTVTAPGWDDVEPSGTASPRAAVEAGIPVEEARGGASYRDGVNDPEGAGGPPSRQAGGSPSRQTGGPERPEPAWEPYPEEAPVGASPYAGPSQKAQDRTVLAARAVQGFAGAAVALAGLRGLRALRRD